MTCGNPFFGKSGTKAYKEACESINTEEHTARMNELHHTDYKPTRHFKTRKTKRNQW